MIATAVLRPQRHAPPAGWPVVAFERLTDALAAALVANVGRKREAEAAEAER